jgi:serine/threonine protein kinase
MSEEISANDNDRSDTAIDDDVNAALSRLRSLGTFTDQQLQWIEPELRRLRNPEQALQLSALQAGTRVGRFTIDQPLGQGGEGNVFRGRDANTGEPVAIKILRSRKFNDRFRREMELVQRLAHPNIVTAYEVGEHQGVPFIAMELLEGPDLDVYVKRHGPLNWSDSLRYVMQITQGLLQAHHRKLIHRDIKPGNVLMNGGGTVKVVDLGLAVITQSKRKSSNDFRTKAGNLAGTVPFMAPEQARSLDLANAQSDIYGIGSTWFFLLTGKSRLPGSSLRHQLNNLLVSKKFNRLPDGCLPDPFISIYQRIVAYEPQDRYASCDELLVDLERALADVGESVPATMISVLVIEDSKTDMIFTIETLRRSNQSLKIYQAASLAEGIEVFHEFRIDLVLLDLTLPDSNGIETVRRFREAARGVPLVVLSGRSEAEVGDACRQAGANEFLSKSDMTVHKIERIIFITHSRAATYRFA